MMVDAKYMKEANRNNLDTVIVKWEVSAPNFWRNYKNISVDNKSPVVYTQYWNILEEGNSSEILFLSI